jgi:ribosomal protein S18 acetylase RimI-like enzyme
MSEQAVRVIRFNPSQAQEVTNLVAATIGGLNYYNDRAQTEEIAKYSPGHLVELSAEDPDSVLLAYSGGRPAGFCISRYDDGLVWLSWFGVEPRCRGRGIGESLLRALAGTLSARRAHKIWCDTRTENIGSQRVLQRVGFVRTGHFTNHWYGQDFFIWEWLP